MTVHWNSIVLTTQHVLVKETSYSKKFSGASSEGLFLPLSMCCVGDITFSKINLINQNGNWPQYPQGTHNSISMCDTKDMQCRWEIAPTRHFGKGIWQRLRLSLSIFLTLTERNVIKFIQKTKQHNTTENSQDCHIQDAQDVWTRVIFCSNVSG